MERRACSRCGDYVLADEALCAACVARSQTPATVAGLYRDAVQVWPWALVAVGLGISCQAFIRFLPRALPASTAPSASLTLEFVGSVLFAVSLAVVAAGVARPLSPDGFANERPLRMGLVLSAKLVPWVVLLDLLDSVMLRKALTSAMDAQLGMFGAFLVGLAMILPLLRRGLIVLWLFAPRALLEGAGPVAAMRASWARWRRPGVRRRVVLAFAAWAPLLLANGLFRLFSFQARAGLDERFLLASGVVGLLRPALALPLLVFALRPSEREPSA